MAKGGQPQSSESRRVCKALGRGEGKGPQLRSPGMIQRKLKMACGGDRFMTKAVNNTMGLKASSCLMLAVGWRWITTLKWGG